MTSAGEQLRQFVDEMVVRTPGRSMLDVTRDVRELLAARGAEEGLLTLFIRHTSASLLVQENADPTVRADLLDAFDRLAPRDHPYRHDSEGPDDMPAHIRASLGSTSLAIPVSNGALLLGTWQGIYVVEHRDRPHRRTIALHFIGRRTIAD